jgi:hypothetical protein
MLPEYRSARHHPQDCPGRSQQPARPMPTDGRSAHSPTERRITYEVIFAAPLAQTESYLLYTAFLAKELL